MNYLYGDSTTSQLKSNFLEFLRDSLDFCVFVLQADAKIKAGRVQIRVLGEEAEAETQRLQEFVDAVQGTVTTAHKGEPSSPTARCGDRLTQLIAQTHQQSLAGIKQMLAEAVAKIEAEESAMRDACVNALALLLAPHDPPDTANTTRLGLLESGHYDATLDGKADPALEWTLELGIPDGHPWAAPMRVDRLVPHLEIRSPQLAGWITKEVRVKPLRIERYVVTEIVFGDDYVTFELRTEPSSEIGFDFHVDLAKDVIKASRVGPADDASVGKFEVQPEDVPILKDLATKLRESLAGLQRIPNIVATFEGADFRTLPEYVEIVERLVGMMSPIVREISARSLTPAELVLRRPLGNDRREEIFVAKSTLREKLTDLPDGTRALFDPLQLDPQLPAAKKDAATKGASDLPPLRSELPPSVPPPPMRAAPPPLRIPAPPTIKQPGSKPPPPPVPGAKARSASDEKTADTEGQHDAKGAKSSVPPGGAASAMRSTLQPPGAGVPPPASGPEVEEAPELEVGPELEMSDDDDDMFNEEKPTGGTRGKSFEATRNEALLAALKRIMTLTKNGRGSEAYGEYAKLFASDAFGRYKPDDQRQALKLMVLAKNHPADTDAVAEAFKAALPRIEKLIEGAPSKDAGDLELFGVTQLALGETSAAGTAFQKALEIERSKNPQSELIATLMRRVSQL